jgi:hypothetical protein
MMPALNYLHRQCKSEKSPLVDSFNYRAIIFIHLLFINTPHNGYFFTTRDLTQGKPGSTSKMISAKF